MAADQLSGEHPGTNKDPHALRRSSSRVEERKDDSNIDEQSNLFARTVIDNQGRSSDSNTEPPINRKPKHQPTFFQNYCGPIIDVIGKPLAGFAALGSLYVYVVEGLIPLIQGNVMGAAVMLGSFAVAAFSIWVCTRIFSTGKSLLSPTSENMGIALGTLGLAATGAVIAPYAGYAGSSEIMGGAIALAVVSFAAFLYFTAKAALAQMDEMEHQAEKAAPGEADAVPATLTT